MQLPTPNIRLNSNSSALKLTSWQAGFSKLDSSELNSSLWLLFTDHAESTTSILLGGRVYSNGSYSLIACVFVDARVCLLSRCLEMNVCSRFAIPAFGRHVKIHAKRFLCGVGLAF
jgi:hypothetical protein